MIKQKTKKIFELFETTQVQGATGSIAGRFILSPFSVLDTKLGDWRRRTSNWKSLGITSGEGRDEELAFKDSFSKYKTTNGRARKPVGESQTSIFDPTLCELMYHWFCPKGGQIVDPFCGGSVRGLVATLMGYKYWGLDIRQEQIDANYAQFDSVCTKEHIEPDWLLGDSVVEIKNAPSADFIFSCPPYGDLEKYSDDPNDLSNMSYDEFMLSIESVIADCYSVLRNNAFACFVISDYRDKDGIYSGFFPDTVNAFVKAGFKWYNDIVLVNSVGSLPLRITKQFNAGRKVGRMHQNVLVFVKGDARRATKKIRKSIGGEDD